MTKSDLGSEQKQRISDAVIGCAIRVSRELGPGFLERVYENALALELAEDEVPFEQQRTIAVKYREHFVGDYCCDFVVDNRLVLEIKALKALLPEHEAQVLNYLKATGINVGLLLNFGGPRLGIKRLVLNYSESSNI